MLSIRLGIAGLVVLVVGLSPLLGLAAKVCLRQPLTVSEGIGGAIAFSGLVLFVLPKLQGTSGDSFTHLTGLGFALLSAATTLAYASLFKSHGAKQPRLTPLLVAFITFAIGSIVIIPVERFSSAAGMDNHAGLGSDLNGSSHPLLQLCGQASLTDPDYGLKPDDTHICCCDRRYFTG